MSAFVIPAPTPWWRPFARPDRWALAWFVFIPLVLFVVPALVGHPAIDADNLIQNFPLRVLAGQQIASGHLPLLDPLTNAGTPLLGGMNAGALYPLTVIFAFIPAIVAWVFNMIVVYVTSAVGVFVLLRWHGIRTLPAGAAALSYTYTGAMIGQMVHIGAVQGFSFIPWAMVVMLALSRRLRQISPDASWLSLARTALPWICPVALLWGLTFLTGEPRAIATIELLTLVVVPCVLLLRTSYWLSTWRLRVAYLATLAVGFAWGVGIGLIQLLPGWSFINFSQRSKVNYSFFGAGSLPVHWTALLLAPDLFGGNGAFGQTGFFANYNLAEVTGYAGVLALVAAAAFLTRVTWKGWRGRERDYVIYVVIGVVGLFATWGSFTPLGHVFRAIPLFGSTRLQSRSIILVDFPLAIILGWWFHQVQDRVSLEWGRRRPQSGLEKGVRWLSALPAILVIALSVALLKWGPSIVNQVGITDGMAKMATGMNLINWLHIAIALAAAVAVLLLRNSRYLFKVLLGVLVADIVVFVVFTSGGLIGGPGPREASRTAALQLLGNHGRFALVDTGGQHTGDYRFIGEPNMNVFTGISSVQGYGALISTIYDDVTGTHPQAMVNACHLADGTFNQLRLGSIAIASSELMVNPELSPVVPGLCVNVKREKLTRRYFGRVVRVHQIIVSGERDSALSTGVLRLQLLNAAGHLVGRDYAATEESNDQAVFTFSHSALGAGFVVTSPTGVEIKSAVLTPYGSLSGYQLNTNFQLAISSSAWRLSSTQEQFSVFKATTVLPEAWLTSPTSNGRVTGIKNASWGDTWVSVTLIRSSTVERSEAYLPGWRATALNKVTGASVQLPVHRVGLIQEVRVPGGSWVIHFHYHAPYIEVSSVISLISDLLFLGVVLGLGFAVRRRRKSKVLA
ncbi:MAG: hypothetical protein JWM55_1662 [Acidimicrobiaceae bacterium]|nr:hypothetical protein [Acidimicrobiaceae bacterium]